MPSKKKRPKKKKKKVEQHEVSFEINFSDITLSATDGDFDLVKKLVEEDVGEHEWTVKSTVTISSPFGFGTLVIDFKSDRSIWIIEYYPSSQDKIFNPDISCLMQWSQQMGWKIPKPRELLVRENISMWKHLWETLLIDSDYLDQRFGERNSVRNNKESREEDDYEEL